MMNHVNDPIVIVSAVRTPMGHFGGDFKNFTTIQLGAAAIKAAIERAKLKPTDIQEVLMGCVLPAGLGQAPARQASILAGVPTSVPCVTLNKVCGSGMQTVINAYDEIVALSRNIIIAGGMENMSRAPYLLPKARFGYRMGEGEVFDHMMTDGLIDPYSKKPMGFFAEQCAKKYNISREEQDAYAIESFRRAKEATDKGYFAAEICPVSVTNDHHEIVTINQDEGISCVKTEKIPKLHPAFVKDGTVTAGNSSQLSDGASALILMRQSEADKKGIKPIAKILGHFIFAHDPDWFTTAPIGAIQGVLDKTGLTINDIDLYEINEAFAVVPIVAIKELKLSEKKVNVYGGACVLGHPLGDTGARIIVTILNALQQRKLHRGIAALCIGGGEATAVVVEMMC
jgi:acetyl-CoA C-acetyltransferase